MKIKELKAVDGSRKTKQIVIAKYKENTKWVRGIKGIPYIIYDKKDKNAEHYLPNLPVFPVHEFEGIKHFKSPTGRESHTYLYHIIKHYHQLADINIFLQGDPVEISSDAREALAALLEKDFEGIDFLPLNFPLVICDKRASPLHTGLPLERVFSRLFREPCPEFFAYSWGAMFCVSKHYIQHRPLAFYEEMMQIVYEEPLSGYVYERLWPTILACHSFTSHPTYSDKDRSSWELGDL